MKIAVAYEDGKVFQHFGKSKYFKVYDIKEGKISMEKIINVSVSGHDALAGLLKSAEVDEVICGGIGMGAQNALFEAGIKFYAGVKGLSDEAVKALIDGKLKYSEEAHCNDSNHKKDEKHIC